MNNNRTRSTLLLLFFVLAAIILGMLVGELTHDISWLSWLSKGADISFGSIGDGAAPLINLSVVKLNFGFQMQINVIQVILISVALFMYGKVK